MKEEPEHLIMVQVAPNEIIAMNVAINYFLRYCKHISPIYEIASLRLLRLQRRIREQLPDQRFPSDIQQ